MPCHCGNPRPEEKLADENKRERKLTPIGFAKWAHLDKPKPSFQGKVEPK